MKPQRQTRSASRSRRDTQPSRPRLARGQAVAGVLIAHSDGATRKALVDCLADHPAAVFEAADESQTLRALRREPITLAVSEPPRSGCTQSPLAHTIATSCPHLPVVVVSKAGSIQEAVEAMRWGACDYVEVRNARAVCEGLLEAPAREHLAGLGVDTDNPALRALVGGSLPMRRLKATIGAFSASDAPVLITGESGTGKELVARALHFTSPRRHGPFVAVNCAAFPDTLLEAELFGHEQGAFTGADRCRIGRLHAANGGTVLFDELAEIPLPVQAKLLRVIENRQIEPLGSNETVSLDVRILSAARHDLAQRVAAGQFRQDLFYRLNVLSLTIPPLRHRPGDVLVLCDHFLRQFGFDGLVAVTDAALRALTRYDYPGNVRELEHAIHHACVLASGGIVDVGHLPHEIAMSNGGLGGDLLARPELGLAAARAAFERAYVTQVLERMDGRKKRTATVLGISRKALWERLKRYQTA